MITIMITYHTIKLWLHQHNYDYNKQKLYCNCKKQEKWISINFVHDIQDLNKSFTCDF